MGQIKINLFRILKNGIAGDFIFSVSVPGRISAYRYFLLSDSNGSISVIHNALEYIRKNNIDVAPIYKESDDYKTVTDRLKGLRVDSAIKQYNYKRKQDYNKFK